MFSFPKEDIDTLGRLVHDGTFFALTCHTNPDGDALGSTLALAHWLRQMGKEAVVVVPDMYPDFLQWLPGAQDAVRADKHPDKAKLALSLADVLFCMDYNTPSRTEQLESLIRESKGKKVLIDHHLEPEPFCDVSFSAPEASSTSELVFALIDGMGGAGLLTSEAAECIYCGMMTDTGAFTYNSSRPEVYAIISRLLSLGIDKDKIYRRVYNNYSEGRLRLIGFSLYEKMRVFPARKAALITLTKKEMSRFQFVKGDTEGLVNMPLQMKGIVLSCFLREDTEKPAVRVSLRSMGRFPCNRFAEVYWNGGGHLNAAGGTFHGTIEEAASLFEKAIAEFSY